MRVEVSKEFIFNNQAGEIYTLTSAVTDHLLHNVPVNDDIVIRLKMILVELLTNSVKHCGNNHTSLLVTLIDNKIILKKTDTGNTFNIRSGGMLYSWPLPGIHHNDKVIDIYSNNNCELKAMVKNNCCLNFFVKEVGDTDDIEHDLNTFSEHFGLMIITKACDVFEYEFDIGHCTNNFVATLHLRA
ncbi:hybrid sensor histidine kinase/response regulator [Mucilaginibacter segetis]|uniref:Uncharacterized protein n=1 Tax=Mucilaginibacter segetis TaxID=2793071 RepID=A0A934PT30_9SPHI|nr:hypothetical protein [Mucilaginibacter segetis]MBK0379017.1 hypothetical protein [Mucilaginibacter segetis]